MKDFLYIIIIIIGTISHGPIKIFAQSENHTFVPHLMCPSTCLASSVNTLWHFGLPGFMVQAERSPRAVSEDGFCSGSPLQLSYTSHVQSMHRCVNITSTATLFRKYFLMQKDLFERNCSCLLSEFLQINYNKKLCLLLFVKQKKNYKYEASAVKKYLALTTYFTYKTYVTYVSNLLIRRKDSANTSFACPVKIFIAWIIKLLLLNRRMKKAISVSNYPCSGFASIMHHVNLWTVLDNCFFTFPEEDPLLLRAIKLHQNFQNQNSLKHWCDPLFW